MPAGSEPAATRPSPAPFPLLPAFPPGPLPEAANASVGLLEPPPGPASRLETDPEPAGPPLLPELASPVVPRAAAPFPRAACSAGAPPPDDTAVSFPADALLPAPRAVASVVNGAATLDEGKRFPASTV